MKTLVERSLPEAEQGRLNSYRARLATGAADLRAAQSLRFMIFNLELQEGMAQSYASCSDADEFDAVCDHLMLEDEESGQIVGTYRMQTGLRAAAQLGYYSEREFDFRPYEGLRPHMLELGRACIARRHRNYAALSALWRGIVTYAQAHGQRYLIGCSSLSSQDGSVAAAVFERLEPHLATPELRTQPQPAYVCPLPRAAPARLAEVPKLLSAYLALGAQICGPPAIDREFKTIDFLTFLDLGTLPESTVRRYLA